MTDKPIAIELAQRTDPGRDPHKQVNEDACDHRETPLGYLAVVCDGMGGHEGGREASNLAVRTIFEVMESAKAGDAPAAKLREAIELANRKVYALAAPGHDASRPGSTVVAVLIHAHGAEIAHVGDSRIYFFHGGQAQQITHDHSMVQQMVDAGLITPEEALTHPNAHHISRALGMKPEVEVEVRPQPLPFVPGDTFLLCSDGLCDLLKPDDMLEIVGAAPPAQAVGQLVDLANARGGHDNITVQLVRTKESSSPAPTTGIAPTVVEMPPTVPDRSSGTLPPPPPPPGTAPAGGAREGVARHDEGAPAHRSPSLLIGIVLALAGIGIAVGALYYLKGSHGRHVPTFVPESAQSLVPTAASSALEPAPSVSASPTTAEAGALVPEPEASVEDASLPPLLAPDASRPRPHAHAAKPAATGPATAAP